MAVSRLGLTRRAVGSLALFGGGSLTRDPAQGSNDASAGGSAGDGTFRSFGVLFMREVMTFAFIGEQRRNGIIGEVRVLELLNNLISLITRGGDAEYRFL